ncbi:MAG TPA: hypothetical protein VJL90_10885 [Pseudorhodoplanes sp.]|nr:hypothetical protein [Pseudorhodoplanes sp.]
MTKPLRTSAIALVTAMLLVPPSGAAPVADIVRKYGLIGTWAPDCAKQATRQNPHVVYRLLDPDRLQRDIMIAPDTNFDVSVVLSIVEIGPGELLIAWKTGEGGITNRVRADPGQMQVLDSTRDSGEKLVVNGRGPRDDKPSPRFNKCSLPSARSTREASVIAGRLSMREAPELAVYHVRDAPFSHGSRWSMVNGRGDRAIFLTF